MSSKPKQKLTFLELTMATILNMVGSSIILMPTKLAEVGTMSIFAWAITILGSTAVAYALARCGMLSRNRAGLGGYAEYAFGKSGSYLANFTYGLSLVIANLSIAVSVVGYGVMIFEATLTPLEIGLATIVLIWLTTVINFPGVRMTGVVSHVFAWALLIPILFLCVAGWFWFSPERFVAAWNPHNMTLFDGISASLSMTLWGFLGLESACANADAVEDPEKNVPRAVLCATAGVAVIYLLSNNVAAGIVDNATLAVSTAPFGLVFATMFTPFVGKVVMGVMALAEAAALMSWQFTLAEVFRGSAAEGYFPKIFARLNKHRVPVAGMLIIVTTQTLLALLTVNPRLEEQFFILVDLAVVTNLVPYLLALAALNVMVQREALPARDAKLTVRLAAVGSVYSLYALYACGPTAMLWGSLATFLGMWLYGYAGRELERRSAAGHPFSGSSDKRSE